MTALTHPTRLIEAVEQQSLGAQPADFEAAEQCLIALLQSEDLDQQVSQAPAQVQPLEGAIAQALSAAYDHSLANTDAAAQLFLQRLLYRINRLNLFWYDDLAHYRNERSFYLQWVRDRIETAWQQWELAQLDSSALRQAPVAETLTAWAEADLTPPLSPAKQYLRQTLDYEGYRRLLAISSLDGLVEASRLSRILGGASNEVQAMLTRVLMEEYGNGRLARKHSTFFAQMMAELNLDTQPEAYLGLAPWELLASINHNFLLTERKRHFLRYNGGLTYFEIAGPSFYQDYLAAAQRLGLSQQASGYWALHIREDERHGQWMLQEVALPLAQRYPNEAWELLLGYAQEKYISDRAGSAILRALQQAAVPLPQVRP